MLSILGSGEFLLKIHKLLNLRQEPAIDFREIENLVEGEAVTQGVADEEDALGVGHAELAADEVARKDVAVAVKFGADAPRFAVAAQTAAADFERAETFLQTFLERAANRHRFADAFHLRVERRVGLWEFLEGKPRPAMAGLVTSSKCLSRKAGSRGFRADVVLEFVEQIANDG